MTWAGFEPQPNVGHFAQASEDGRYMDGIVAGSLTKSNIIGYPVGFPFEEVNRALNAFTLGAREVNPDAEVRAVYLNTWFDPAIEQQAAEALANAGADVIAHEVGSQVYATVMAQNDGYVIGYTNDWSDFEPEAWASSLLFDWSTYYIEQIEAILAGEFEAGHVLWWSQRGLDRVRALRPRRHPGNPRPHRRAGRGNPRRHLRHVRWAQSWTTRATSSSPRARRLRSAIAVPAASGW